MREVRVFPSDPENEHLSHLANLIAIATNPQCHFGGVDLPEPERKALISTLKGEMGLLMLSHAAWREFLGGLLR